VMIALALSSKCRHQPMSAAAEKYRCRTYTPSGRRGNGTPTEDDGGDDRPGTQLEMSAPADVSSSGKISLQDLYPPGRRGNGTPTEDDGGGLKDLDFNRSQRQPKEYRCRTYTPRAGEESFHLREDNGGSRIPTSPRNP
jgi:hypothetical protein